MRNLDRYIKAKQLRDSGSTFREIGAELGVTASWARQIVYEGERQAQRLKREKDNPKLVPWHRGLKNWVIYALERCGFESKEDCLILCSNDLNIYHRAVTLPGWQPTDRWEWKYSNKRLSISLVNEVRAWLGVEPFVPHPRPPTTAQLKWAKKLLERAGYKVVSPNDSETVMEPTYDRQIHPLR